MELEKHPTQQENKCYPNMPAFASEHSFGLTKREYFAAMAMQLLSRQNWNPDVIAEESIIQADELIKALNK